MVFFTDKGIYMHLITFSDLCTHSKDKLNIFLDERLWLNHIKKKGIDHQYIIAKPYGLGNEKVKKDYFLKKQLYKNFFPDLCTTLNQFHGVNHSQRFWNIVVGHWLDKYLSVVINREGVINKCFLEYPISSTTMFEYDPSIMATNDLTSFINACDDELWSHYLYQLIIKYSNIKTDNQIIKLPNNKQSVFLNNRLNLKKVIKNLIYEVVFKILNIFSGKKDGVIINTYLPKMIEAKLCISLGQVPLFRRTKNFKVTQKANFNLRDKLTESCIVEEENTLEYIAKKLLFQLLPICYLEGFSEMNTSVNKLPWPKNPNFIFTSNSFHSDELFKLWTAIKTQEGSKYFVGQHGNNYGTSVFLDPSMEEDNADEFITWGWSNNLKQIPAFAFSFLGQSKKYNSSGGLLLVQEMMYQKDTTWDGAAHFSEYLNDLFDLTKGLNSSIKKDLTVRLHKYSRKFDFAEERWNNFSSEVKIDLGEESIEKKYNENRLVIHGYDSTGILETLSSNIPTLALLNFSSYGTTGIAHIQDTAKPYYNMLIEAGIIHLSVESLNAKVNNVYDDVDTWWNQKLIQDARNEFCNLYSRFSDSPVRDLNLILQS
jgi:putative transferase (TIGR04331 family)